MFAFLSCLSAIVAWSAFAAGTDGGTAVTPGLRVSGLARAGTLSRTQLEALGAVKTTWKWNGEHTVEGVPLDVLLTQLGWTPGPMGHEVAKKDKRRGYRQVVVATASDGFQAVLSVAELMPKMGPTRALVVWSMDGHALAGEQGPLRLVVLTDQEPSRSIYGLAQIDVVDVPQATR